MPLSDFVPSHSRRSLLVHFDDVTSPTPNKVEPTLDPVSKAIKFGFKSDKLIVCCKAGQSRSAAVALSIAYDKLGKNLAFAILNPKRHSPNVRILQLADEVIDRPSLLDHYDEWGIENGDIRLTDFLDEIESEYDELERMGARDRISSS